MYLKKEMEKLFFRYMNLEEFITPGEVHELARGLLEAVRLYLVEHQKESLSFYECFNELLDRYHDTLIELPDYERPSVLKWWKENWKPIAAIQGVIAVGTAMGGGVFKVLVASTYKTQRWWATRCARKYIEKLEKNLRKLSGGELKIDIKGSLPRKAEFDEMVKETEVSGAEPEVTELADELLLIRKNVYGT